MMFPLPFIPVILSGGSGVRLWPLSQPEKPKQFLPLFQNKSLFHETLKRLPSFFSPPLLIGNKTHKDLIAQEMDSFSSSEALFIGEPVGRNTTAAITLAALQGGPHCVLAIFPADHWISHTSPLEKALEQAYQIAQKGALVTLGIAPRSPETGYGYIQKGAPHPEVPGTYLLQRFVEKPPLAEALSMLRQGDFFWNSGIFVFHGGTFLEEVQKLQPAILSACQEALSRATSSCQGTLKVLTLEESSFKASPSIAVDYGIMEKTSQAFLVPVAEMGWSDVGSWQGLWQVSPQDEKGNVRVGDILCQETSNCYIHATHRLVATLGVTGLTIIETPEAVYVGDQGHSQEIRQLVCEVEKRKDL